MWDRFLKQRRCLDPDGLFLTPYLRELLGVNGGDEMANVEITLLYADREPVDGYRLSVAPRRVRAVRMNDLIFPYAMPLETPYAAVIASDVPVVVQFTRQDTRQRENALLGTIAFPADD